MPRHKNKQPNHGVLELLKEAEVMAETLKPPTVQAHTPYVDPGSRLRRTARLIPAIPPLTPASQWANDPINPKTHNQD